MPRRIATLFRGRGAQPGFKLASKSQQMFGHSSPLLNQTDGEGLVGEETA